MDLITMIVDIWGDLTSLHQKKSNHLTNQLSSLDRYQMLAQTRSSIIQCAGN